MWLVLLAVAVLETRNTRRRDGLALSPILCIKLHAFPVTDTHSNSPCLGMYLTESTMCAPCLWAANPRAYLLLPLSKSEGLAEHTTSAFELRFAPVG